MRTRKTPSLVAVSHDGKVYFGSDQINPDDLTGKVKDRLANKTDKRVFIKADARARYGKVVEVVDDIRSAGVDDVGLLTEQKKDNRSRRRRQRPPSRRED